MNWIWLLIIALLVFAAEAFRIWKAGESSNEKGSSKRSDYSNCYQRKYLLTKNEYREYMKLRQYAAVHELLICPKVRLLDIIEPRKGEKDYKSLFWKIQAKHVDFVICDQDLRIKGILELDDSSHDQKERQDRDAFVDLILQSVGYQVIHTRSVTESTLSALLPTQAEDATPEQ